MAATLLIDIGNTRLKWRALELATGLTENDAAGAVLTTDRAELVEQWEPLKVGQALIASVAGPDALAGTRTMIEECFGGIDIAVLASAARQCGVVNCYRKPERLGPDRWAALIGARALFPTREVVIANLGTATTVDWLRPDGRFEGGVILPGLSLMRTSLARRTAALPLAQGQARGVAQNTEDAIASGVQHAQAGAIERVVRETGQTPVAPEAEGGVLCLLTGGDAAALAPRLPFPTQVVDNLVLRGLVEIARELFLSRQTP